MLMTLKKEKKFLLILFLISFFVRALFFVLFLSKDKNHFLCDSFSYHEIGLQIAKGDGVSFQDRTAVFFRVPGFPVFLGLCYKAFGADPLKSLWVQIILASFLPLFIFGLSIVLFPKKLLLAKIAGVFAAFHFGYVLFSGLLMTETLFCFFFFIFLILFLKDFKYFFCEECSEKFSYFKIFVAGICLGFASLIRPVGPPMMVLGFLLILFCESCFYVKLKKYFVFFLGWFLIVFSWLLRNYLLTGFVFFHTWNGVHFMHYFASPIYMKIHGGSFSQASRQICVHEFRALLEEKEKLAGHKFSEIEKCSLGESVAFEYAKKCPLTAIKIAFYNMFKTCLALYSSDLLNIVGNYAPACYDQGVNCWIMMKRFLLPQCEKSFVKFLIWYEIFFWFLILIGFLFAVLSSFFDLGLFCALLKILPFLVVMIFMTFASGVARLRLPIEPLIIIFSLNGWINFLGRKGLYEK